MPAAYFSFSGKVIAFHFEDAQLMTSLRRLIGFAEMDCALSATQIPDCLWHIHSGQPILPPPELPPIHLGKSPFSNVDCVFHGSDDHHVLCALDRLSIEMRFSEKRGRVTIAAGSEHLLDQEFGMNIAAVALAMTGQTLLHAAALRCPDTDQAFLIFAPSGVGKTTTTLALVEQGFGFVTDDASIVEQSGADWIVCGFPRAMNVHKNTVSLMPWLARHLGNDWDSNGEQPLFINQLTHLTRGESMKPAPLSAIIWLQDRTVGPVRMEVPDKMDVLIAMASDHVRHGLSGIPGSQLSIFETLSRLVRDLPVFSLQIGDDLAECGKVISQKLGPIRAALVS